MNKVLLFFLIPVFGFTQTQIGQDIDGEAAGNFSGTSVSMSSDGSFIAIGATGSSSSGFPGQVRIYENQNGSWAQVGQDIDGEAAGDLSGSNVSISSDGSIVAVGAPFNDGNGSRSGHVRIYKNQNGSWIQVGQDIDGEAAEDFCGEGVSLSSDGTTVAVGSPNNDGNGNNSGHVRIYKNQGGTWIQVGQDIDGESAQDTSGEVVSLSSEGDLVAIGAIRNDGNGSNSGHVRVYENQNGTWVQIGQDIDGEAAEDYFSGGLSLSSDGSIVAISSSLNDGNGDAAGHVRIYENQSGTWTQIGQDIDGEVAVEQSGRSVSLSMDGNIVVSGSLFGNSSGLVRIHENQNGTWVQIGDDIFGEAAGDFSGSAKNSSLSLSSDGTTVAIGAHQNDGNGNSSGHARVYDLSSVLSVTEEEFYASNISIYPNPTSTFLNIHLSSRLEFQKVIIYNNLGQLISEENKARIDISKYSKGFYFTEIITGKGKITKKFIVE